VTRCEHMATDGMDRPTNPQHNTLQNCTHPRVGISQLQQILAFTKSQIEIITKIKPKSEPQIE